MDYGQSCRFFHVQTENNAQALKALFAKLKKLYKKEIDKLIWVFESTGSYSSLIYRFCAQKGIWVFMPNPKRQRLCQNNCPA